MMSAASILLYRSYAGETSTHKNKQIGSITFKRRTAQRKYDNQPVWELLSKDSPVYNHDRIRTSEGSLSVVYFKDKDEIVLDENTFVYLYENEEDEGTLEFLGGSIYAKGGNENSLVIVSGDSKIDVSDGEAFITKGSDNQTTFTVTEGTISLNSAQGKKVIKKDEIAVLDGKNLSIEKCSIFPVTPLQNEFILSLHDEETVFLEWKSDEDGPFEVTVAQSLDFSESNIISSNKKKTTLKLPLGDYYWQVSSKNGEKSSIGKFSIIHDKPATLVSPPQNKSFTYYSTPPKLYFNWNGSPHATSYRLEIGNSPSFDSPVLSKPVTSSSTAVDTLGAGSYYWKIVSLYEFGSKYTSLTSKSGSFSIAQSNEIPVPLAITPSYDTSISKDYFEKNNLIFSWEPNNDITDYTLEISSTEDFENKIFTKSTDQSSVTLDKKLKPGIYYWHVAYFDPAENTERNSTIQRFTVTEITELEPLYPQDKSLLSFQSSPFTLQWFDNSNAQNYRVDIYKDKSSGTPYVSTKTKESSYSFTPTDSSTYFWQVHILNKKDGIVTSSLVKEFKLADKEIVVFTKPQFIYPQDGTTIDMTKKSSLPVKWNKLEGADSYTLSLRQKNSSKVIYSIKTSSNSFTFKDLTLFEKDSFTLTIKPEQKGTINSGEAGVTTFTLTLKPLKKPKLITDTVYVTE